MTNLSLCSGYGGLDLAVEQITGNKTLIYAEKDPFASRVMEARFPWATNLGDITKINWEAVAQDHHFDTVSAGFPCQDISHDGGDEAAGATGELNLLPSPTVADSRGTRNFTAKRRPGAKFNPGKTLTDFAWLLSDERWVSVDGVDYGPAIRRWENTLGRPAPDPTDAGRTGNRRITPEFTEWLMGLDEGWVTDVDIPRAKQQIALGNGVIPRQAVEGYRRLLTADLEAMAA